jgi:ABC-type dipeptide/oligopeptide/nickel transport system ATPase component
VTQSLDDVEEFWDNIAVMTKGSIVEFGPNRKLFQKYGATYTLKITPTEEEQNKTLRSLE